MTESDKLTMTLNIGGERFTIEDVPFKEQDLVRDSETDVIKKFDEYRRMNPSYTPAKILAMVAYRFAARQRRLSSILEESSRIAEECNNSMNSILEKNIFPGENIEASGES